MDSSISRRPGVIGGNAVPPPSLPNLNVSRPPQQQQPSPPHSQGQRQNPYHVQPLPTSSASPFSPLSRFPASPLAFPVPNANIAATSQPPAVAEGPSQWNTTLSSASHSPLSPANPPYSAAGSPIPPLSSPSTPYTPTPAPATTSTTVRRKVHVAASSSSSSTAVDMTAASNNTTNISYSSKSRRSVKSSRSHSCLSPIRTLALLIASLLVCNLYWAGVITPFWGALFGPAYPPAAPYLQIISVIRDMDAQLVQQNPAEMTLQLNAVLSWVDAVSTPPACADNSGIITQFPSRAEFVHVYARDIRTCSYLRSASPRLERISCHGFPAVDSRTGHALLYPMLAHAHARMEEMERERVQMLRAAQVARGVRKRSDEEDDEEDDTKQYVMLLSGHGSTSVSPLITSQLQYVDSNVESTSLYSLTSSLVFMHTRSTLNIPVELIRSRLVGADSVRNTQELLRFADEEAEESLRVEKAQLYARARKQEVDEVLMNPDGIGSTDSHTAASNQHAASGSAIAKSAKPAAEEDTTPPPQLSYLIYDRSLVFDIFPSLPRRASVDTDWSSRTRVNEVVRTKNASLAENKDTLRKSATNQNTPPVPTAASSSLPRLYAAFHGWEPLVFCALHKLKRIQAKVVDLSLLKNSAHAHATSMAKASSKKKQVYQRIQMQHLAEQQHAAEENWAEDEVTEGGNGDVTEEEDDDEVSDMLALTESSPHNLAIAKSLCGRFYANAGLHPTIPYALVPQDRAQFQLEQQQQQQQQHHDATVLNVIDKTKSWDREQPKEKGESNAMQCPPFCLLRQSVPSLIPAYNASSPLTASEKSKHMTGPSVSFTPRAELLLRYADTNGWVTILPVDTLSLPFAFNWLCWAEGLGSFRNFVFLAEDLHSAKELHQRNYPVLLSPDPQLHAVSSMIVSHSAPFERRMKHRWGVANEAARAGVNVYFASVKAVWYRSPLSYIDRKSVSVLAQLSFLSSLLQIFHVVPQGDSHIAVRADQDGRKFSRKMRKCHKKNVERLRMKRERQLRENAAMGFTQEKNKPSVSEDPSVGFDQSLGEVPASAANVDTPTATSASAVAEEELVDCFSETLKVLQQRHMAEQVKRAKLNPKAATTGASSMMPQSNVPKAPLRDRFGRMVRQPTAAAAPTQVFRSTFLDTFNPFLMPDGWTAMEEFEPQNRFIQPFMLSLTSTSADIKEGVKRIEESKSSVVLKKKQIIASDEEPSIEDQIANYRLVESQWHTLDSWNLNLLRPTSSLLAASSDHPGPATAGASSSSSPSAPRVHLDRLEHGDDEHEDDAGEEGEEETQLLGRRDSPATAAAEVLHRRKRREKRAMDGILPPVSIASLYPSTTSTAALLAANSLGLAGSKFSTACRVPKRPNPPSMIGSSKDQEPAHSGASSASVSNILASVSKLRAAVTTPHQAEPVASQSPPPPAAASTAASSTPLFDLTVRILAYARPKRLKRLLDSAVAADYPAHARVHFQICVDSPASLDKASSSLHSASASISASGDNSAATEPDVAGWLDVHSVIEEFEQHVLERFSRSSIGESARITVSVKRMERHAGVNAMWTQPFDEKSSIETSADGATSSRNESIAAQASATGKHHSHLLMVLSDDQELNFSWYSWLTRVLTHFYFSNGFDSRVVGLSLADMHVSLSEPLDRPLREALFTSELLGDLSSVKQSWYKLQQWRSSAFLFFPFHYRTFLTWLARRHSFHALTSPAASPSSSTPASPLSRAAFISRLDRYTPCVPGMRTNLLWPIFRDRVQQALFGVDSTATILSDPQSSPSSSSTSSIIPGDVWWIWLNRFLFEKGLYSLYVHLKDITSYPARTQYLTLGHVERQRFESMQHLDDSYETILGEGEELLIEIGITEPAESNENEPQTSRSSTDETQEESDHVATVDEYYEQFKEPFSDSLSSLSTFPASNSISVYDPLFRRVPLSFEEAPFKPTPGVTISAMETQLSASPVSLLHLRSSSVPPLVYDQCFLARATPTSVLRSSQRLRLSQVHKDLFIHFKKGRFYSEQDLVKARNQDMLRITVREQRRAAEEALAEREAEQRMIERRKQREKQMEEQAAQADHAAAAAVTSPAPETHRDDSL